MKQSQAVAPPTPHVSNCSKRILWIILSLGFSSVLFFTKFLKLDETASSGHAKNPAPAVKIIAKWVINNPGSRNRERDNFVYYTDMARAFNNHRDVTICTSILEKCFEQASHAQEVSLGKTIFVALLDQMTTTQGPNSISKATTSVVHDLNSIFSSKNYSSPETSSCTTVVAMINKAYKSLDEKIKAFKDPFDQNKDVKRNVNLMATTWSPHADNWSKRFNLPFAYIPFATRVKDFNLTSKFIPWEERSCDIFLRWDTNPEKYELRQEIHDLLVNNRSEKVAEIDVSAPAHFLHEDEYIKEITMCKISVTTIGMPGRLDLFGTRYFEIMASGTTLLFVQRPDSNEAKFAQKELGMIDGLTVVEFSNTTELLEKVQFYKKSVNQAYKIIHNAQEVGHKQVWEERANAMVDAIHKHTLNCNALDNPEVQV